MEPNQVSQSHPDANLEDINFDPPAYSDINYSDPPEYCENSASDGIRHTASTEPPAYSDQLHI